MSTELVVKLRYQSSARPTDRIGEVLSHDRVDASEILVFQSLDELSFRRGLAPVERIDAHSDRVIVLA
ncbi:hypothetical protein [Mycolicibacterium sp. YH-1]|uniref:hypothetical protein n=1 Tax=Mycolicibacterium sp. YH-1 TaxID=2908837 RepID=UPI001F4C0053|nr:hypothetical protein [Mycolicibacterium sp. YH-1]UNB52651.1 hypothetical protein L0M16_33250 [Mycolicibacterium sp. YH-1]